MLPNMPESFFFFLRTDRKTFILSTTWDMKSCNIQRFIEVIGVWFLWGGYTKWDKQIL